MIGRWQRLKALIPAVVGVAGLALFIGGDLAGDRMVRALGAALVGLALVAAILRVSSWR